MAKTTRTSVKLALEENDKAEFLGMAKTLGQNLDNFTTEAVLEYMQTLNDNPDRFNQMLREGKRTLIGTPLPGHKR